MKNDENKTRIFEVKPCPNPDFFRVLAIWVPHGVSATWATLHHTVIPEEWLAYAKGSGEKPDESHNKKVEQDYGNV